MNSKKHFQQAADIVRLAANNHDAKVLREAFIVFFKSDNARFDEGRFRVASATEAPAGKRQGKS